MSVRPMSSTPSPKSVLSARHAAIQHAITPLPGSTPRDHFKPLNDKYGHNVGDLLLAEVASRIKNSVRAMAGFFVHGLRQRFGLGRLAGLVLYFSADARGNFALAPAA